MRLDGRRESSNVEDRRGQSGGRRVSGGSSFGSMGGGGINIIGLLLQLLMSGKGGSNGQKGGCGIKGILLIVIVLGAFYLLGGQGGGCSIDPSMLNQGTYTEQTDPSVPYTGSAQEEELAIFTKKILAGTEDVWTKIFAQNGRTYKAPKLVMFTDAVQSGCGGATSSSGPFYCSADQTVYIDLSFFMNMRQQIGADGDFAYAYVIAHEVGHHVQYLLGDLNRIHSQMSRSSEKISNQLSVRLELQADFYAGIWAYYDNQMFRSLEEGDIDEGLNAARKIGDDYLQKKQMGYAIPESFNHGTSAQRSKWLKKGAYTGDLSQGDSFSPSYESL